MNHLFANNLLGLRRGNLIVAIIAGSFSLFPIIAVQSLLKLFIYLGVALFALLLSIYSNYVMQQINVKTRVIYLITILFYANIMIFATYLDIWSYPDSVSALFPCFVICILLMFVNPPRLNFFLTLSATTVFVVCTIIVKESFNASFYIVNAVVAAIIGLYLNWHISKLRMGLEISATKLEEERNKYEDQSITDELTQLRNRRDFMQTFQRYLSSYRSSDDWLCLAIADIDFFKNYNDHYGHLQGDECLKSFGKVLNSLSSSGVYAARVGGEEFALLWFEKDPSNVDKIVLEWTDSIRNLEIPHEKSKVSDYVTMSVGIYIVRCGSHQDMQILYDLADKALYTAKGSGRNCTIACGDEIKQYKITPPSN